MTIKLLLINKFFTSQRKLEPNCNLKANRTAITLKVQGTKQVNKQAIEILTQANKMKRKMTKVFIVLVFRFLWLKNIPKEGEKSHTKSLSTGKRKKAFLLCFLNFISFDMNLLRYLLNHMIKCDASYDLRPAGIDME